MGMTEPNQVTINTILNWFQEQVEDKVPVAASIYIDAAQKLVALMGPLDDSLIEAEMTYRRIRSIHISEGKTAAAAETLAKSSDAYYNWLQLKAKRDRVEHFINLCKARTRLQAWDQ